MTFHRRAAQAPGQEGLLIPMARAPCSALIRDTIRKALADELLFGRLTEGGRLTVDDNEHKTDEQGRGEFRRCCFRTSSRRPQRPWAQVGAGRARRSHGGLTLLLPWKLQPWLRILCASRTMSS